MRYTSVPGLKKLRWSALILGISNVIVIGLDLAFIIVAYPACAREDFVPFFTVLIVSCLRILAMIRIGTAQQASANIILNLPEESAPGPDCSIRHEKRMRYRRWHWWTWFSAVITLLQFLGAVYLLYSVGNLFHTSTNCVSGVLSVGHKWKHYLLILFMIMVSCVALVQWFVGSDVLRWRSFYAAEDDAWKAHYREVFDHGIREALCCLGRIKYLSDSEDDEIYSVAKLLGDLVAYRASGTGHLEFLAGLALLKRHCLSPKLYEASSEVPEDQIQEAANLHPFAEAAYTGLLLDVGRNPVLFPCAWVYRQGILTPWARHRWPLLEGDNWWRGHAAAFLNYTNLSPEVLRRGRVNQEKCKAAYFIVVLHHLKSVVIAVRGTETPEDLITDGLGRECTLTVEDLDGLINGSNIQPGVRHKVISSLPHYGHSGIVEAARDLYMQIEGNCKEDESQDGFLSSLLSSGSECDGYSLRIVGHSLGGAIGAMVAIRLYRRYPKLHVYTYGPLPCLDSVIAEACSDFVTSIVHDNEFSARLSVASILRLRADAMMALSQDATADSTMIYQLACRFLFLSKHQQNDNDGKPLASDLSSISMNIEGTHNDGSRREDIELSVWRDVGLVDNAGGSHCSCPNPFCDPSANVNIYDAPITQIMETVPLCGSVSSGCIPEMFLPGVVIHIVPQKNSIHMPLWKSWISGEEACSYRAYIAKREAFKDIVVSTHMFLDHLPWRCNYAMKKVLEKQNPQILLDRSQIV